MRNVTLRQMRVFTAVARHGSFTRAARELHLSQPAVSQQIKLLEQEAGLPLFEHIGRTIHVTAAGEELLRYASQVTELLREAAEIMLENKIGCLPVTEGTRLVGILTEADFVRDYLESG